ncbi:15181_t:CDS:2, partial [Acaulospora morrowiae]
TDSEVVTLEPFDSLSIFIMNVEDEFDIGIQKCRFGLILNKEVLTKTEKECLNFISVLNIRYVNPDRSTIINLVTTKSKVYSYFLENNLAIEEQNARQFFESVPFKPLNIISTKVESTFRAIYFAISIPIAEIRFEDIKPSSILIQALEESLLSTNPYILLQEVFEKFGHLIPRKIIVGKKLSRYCQKFALASYHGPSDLYKKISLSAEPSEQIDKLQSILDEWKKLLSADRFDSTYIVSTEGRAIETKHVKRWILRDCHQLEIVEYSDFIPTYTILNPLLCKEIEKCFKKESQILMTGYISIEDIHTHYYRVKFDTPLQANNYQIFGFITREDNIVLEKSIVAFKYFTKFGFSIVIKSLNYEQLNGAMISWIMIGIPCEVGFYSKNTRTIDVLQMDALNVAKNSINSFQKDDESIIVRLPSPTKITFESIINIQIEFSQNTSESFIETQYLDKTNDVKIISQNDNFDNSYLNELRIHYLILSFPTDQEWIVPDVRMDSRKKLDNLRKENMGYRFSLNNN